MDLAMPEFSEGKAVPMRYSIGESLLLPSSSEHKHNSVEL